MLCLFLLALYNHNNNNNNNNNNNTGTIIITIIIINFPKRVCRWSKKAQATAPKGPGPGHKAVDDSPLSSALMDFCTMVLHGDVPAEVRPLFSDVSLLALHKKTGEVWPIAVGCTLHCLVAKIASRLVRDEITSLLGPKQLGFGVRDGAEAAVHAARRFCQRYLWIMQL